MKISTILDQIDDGAIALPVFQRGYVWNRDQVRELMESLYRRHPVGSLLTWVTRTENVNSRGDSPLQPGYVKLLLDGQQRITTLYGIIRGKGPPFFEGTIDTFTGLHFNMETENFQFYAPVRMSQEQGWISVTELMDRGIGGFIGQIQENPVLAHNVATYIDRLNRIHTIRDVDLHVEDVTGEEKTVDLVVDIFNRVNSGGTKLSKGDLALAKICAGWPEARAEMNFRLERWKGAGFHFKLEWLLRCVNSLTAPSGPAKISKRVMDGTEVVWSVTRSTAVAVPTARSTTTPPQTLVEAEYSIGELAMWYERLGDVIWGIRGIAWTDLNETANRIDIGLYPRRGTRGELEAVLTALDIPREAIVIEDGCEGVSQWPHEVGKSFEEASLRAFDYSLEAVSRVTYGETVRMKLTIQNATDEPVAFVLGGRPPYDFVVTTPGGEGVWFWMCGKITNSVRDGKTLEPGEKLELVGEWEQVDNRGEPVPPGTYVVRGVLTLGQTDLGPPDEVLVTETHELQVQIPTTSDSPSPTATPTPAPMPTPGQDHLEGPPEGPGVEIGTGYPYTLYVHCGIRDAHFDGRLWMADPMLSDGSGNPPLDWAPGDSEGIMELVDDDLAVFTAESGRTIQFKPWPLDVEWRPCA